jgi:prepilin-type N-terminal cleavage/methylation domain-containing protein
LRANAPFALSSSTRHSPLVTRLRSRSYGVAKARHWLRGFTLIELLVVMGIIAILMVFLVPAFNSINSGRGLTRAINDVSGILELARAEAMSTRSYVYVGFANTTNSDGNSELHIGAVISIDGSSNTASTNLRVLSRSVKIPNVKMTNYTDLPQAVKSVYGSDASLNQNSDYVITFTSTTYLQGKFNDTALNNCPTIVIAPQGEIAHDTNPAVFFRTTASVGLAPTHGTTGIDTNGAIVSFYGGTGQLRVTTLL